MFCTLCPRRADLLDHLTDDLAEPVNPDDDIGRWKRRLVAAVMLAAMGVAIWAAIRWVQA